MIYAALKLVRRKVEEYETITKIRTASEKYNVSPSDPRYAAENGRR